MLFQIRFQREVLLEVLASLHTLTLTLGEITLMAVEDEVPIHQIVGPIVIFELKSKAHDNTRVRNS
jgi:hypothetical protein